jgi:hypothetical protein
MRTTLYHCNRCGDTITDARHSILKVEAGELVKLHDEPSVDLCGSCGDSFENWLRSGKEGVQSGLGAPLRGPVGETAGKVA